MVSFTEDENYSNNHMHATDPRTIAWPTWIIAFLSSLNIVLSITASLGNILILTVLPKVTSLHPPTKLLFRCLAFTDLCVGLLSHPLHAIYFMSHIHKMNSNVISYIEVGNPALSLTLCGVSVLASTAISVDRLFALLLGLRYRHIVTLRRVWAFTVCSWLVSASCGLMQFWSFRIAWIVAFNFATLCLATSIFSYTRIYLKLRQHQVQVQGQFHQQQPANGEGIPLNIGRFKKTVSSILWVQVALVFCYVPFCVVSILRINDEKYDMAWLTTATLVYLNSSLNPILYCWKIREVRRAARNALGQIC